MRASIIIVIAVLALATAAYFGRALLPPESIRFAAGFPGGGYWQVAESYREILAEDGIVVELVETEGSVDNIRRLVAGEVDVVLVQGGLSVPSDQGLESLGALFVEPLLVFHRASDAMPRNPADWRGLRVAAGTELSGTRAALLELADAATLKGADVELVLSGGADALADLRDRQADLAFFVAPLDAPYIAEALLDPDLTLMRLNYVEALAPRLPEARRVVLPAGGVSLDPPLPTEDVALLAFQASMIASAGLHPAAVDRLAMASLRLYSKPTLLNGASAFPNALSSPVPVNNEARNILEFGAGRLHALLPYWVAAQFGQILTLIVPLLVLLPVLSASFTAYAWSQRRRVWRHYSRIRDLERDLYSASSADQIDAVEEGLQEIYEKLAELNLPLVYRSGAYDARHHIDLIRKEIARRRS